MPLTRNITVGNVSPEPDEVPMVAYNFANLTTGAMTVTDFRNIFGDPTLGFLADEAANFTKINDPTYGKILRFSMDNEWYGKPGSRPGNGIAWQPWLPEAVEDCAIEYYIRVNTDYQYGLGGKWMGIGGSRINTATGQPYAVPSGGSHTVNGYSARVHWGPAGGRNDRWHAYGYLPWDNVGFGEGFEAQVTGPPAQVGQTGVAPNGFGAGEVHKIKLRVKHNTVNVEGSTTQPNDGKILMYQDDVLIGDHTTVTRYYSDTLTRRTMLSIFRGGSADNWDVPADGTVDFWGIRLLKYVP